MKGVLLLFGALAFGAQAQNSASDSLPPAFRQDSTKLETIRNLEAGKTDTSKKTPAVGARADSLDAKLRHRGPFIGATVSFAFSDLSSRDLFAHHMATEVSKDSLTSLQSQDPVTVYFPLGLSVAIPVFPYLDIWLRSESFWYKTSGLAQDKASNTREYWYAVHGNLMGAGARYLIPISLLSVNAHPGLFVSYTHLWNAGNSGIYAGTGSVRAKMEPAGVGYEIQTGFQQDFNQRWAWTGGLAFTSLSFKSNSSWRSILSDAPDENASWTLRSLRLCLQGFYQFGTARTEKQK